jgi:hypothetical protein
MTAQPEVPGPDTGSYEVIHLGGQAAVVVPVADFLRLRALERAAAPQELEDAEDTAASWSGRPVTPPGRRRSSLPRKHGAGSACRGEPAVDYDERAISQATAFLDDWPRLAPNHSSSAHRRIKAA